jgi:hypothetical protein
MGWGNGMAIGWPNASYQQGGPTIYEIPLFSCSLDPTPFITCYSSSPSFAVGIYLYRRPDLTDPYNGPGGELPGFNQYIIVEGLITPDNFSCG